MTGRPAEGRPRVTPRPAPARDRGAVVVRAATPDDLPVVLELRLALLHEHGDSLLYGRLRPDARRRAERLYAAQLESAHEITFLAEVGGAVVGVLRCLEGVGAPLLLPERYGYVSSVYVRPAARRCGVLRALFAAAEGWSAARGLRELRLHNAAENAVANAVWERLGFRAVEVLRIRPVPDDALPGGAGRGGAAPDTGR